MATIDKIFTGKLNLDDSINLMEKFDYLDSLNITKDGVEGSSDMAVTNIAANRSVPYTLPSGVNQVIGAQGDPLRNVMYYFVWNANLKHSVLKYNNTTRVITKLLENLTDTAGVNILAFNRYKKIIHIDVIHRGEDEGDLIYWVDTENRPRKINEQTIQSFVPISEDIINAAKNPPFDFLTCTYGDDSNVTVNNLRKKLFQFAMSWIYQDGEESTLSPLSKVPLPVNGYDPDTNNDPTKNNNISFFVTGGGKDYQKVKIYGRELVDITWSDYFLIDTLDRDDYPLLVPNGSMQYFFFNDSVYPFQDPVRTTLLFDWLPDKSNTQALANGNVLVYGGITEGFNNMAREDVDVQITSGSGAPNVPTISFIYSGSSSIVGFVGTVITVGTVYHVEFNYVSGGVPGSKSINYITIIGDTQDSVAAGIVALLNGGVISSATGGAGTFNVIITGLSPSISDVLVNASLAGSENAAAAWNWYSKYRFVLVYLNDLGKPISITSFTGASLDTNDFSVTTPDFSVVGGIIQVPFINASINHTPPVGATKFQWGRTTNLTTNSFLYWITNDYQTDTDYLYFCIENLDYTAERNTGFVPSYEFTKGDHIRLIAKYAAGTITTYNIQLDFEIVGVVDRTMTSPASTGRFIKVAKPSTLPSLAYSANMIIELYTPALKTAEVAQVFYEWDEVYSVFESGGNRFHEGKNTNQSLTQPATYQWYDGDVYFKNRQLYLNVNATTTIQEFTMDANYNDYFASKVNSNGRAWPLEPDAKIQYFPTLIRFGQAYQPDTNINGLNRFYPDDLYDKCNRAYGDILKLSVKGSYLRVGQKFKIGNVPVLLQIVKDGNGNDILSTSDVLLNQIVYYVGDYGVGDTPESWTEYNNSSYFTYSTRGIICRLSLDGITPISVLSKVNSWATSNLPLRTGNYKVYGVYDPKSNNYIIALEQVILSGSLQIGSQGYIFIHSYFFTLINTAIVGDIVVVRLTDGNGVQRTYSYTVQSGDTVTTIYAGIRTLINADIYFTCVLSPAPVISQVAVSVTDLTALISIIYSPASINGAKTLSFDEESNQFESFLSYKPEMMCTLGDLLITFKNGGMWTHDSPTEYNNFYGVAYESYITAPFNQGVREKKTFTGISQIANTTWDCPVIYSNVNTYGSQRQETNLIEAEFATLEGNPTTSIKRDINSPGGKINGQFIKGNYLVVKLRKTSANTLVTLNEASVNYITSPLTSK